MGEKGGGGENDKERGKRIRLDDERGKRTRRGEHKDRGKPKEIKGN